MLLPHGTVVAVVDGVTIEVFRNSGNESAPTLEKTPAPKLDTHNKSSGTHHHSSSGNPDGHQLKEDAHAASATEWLNHQVLANAIQHLVIIAPPRTMGEMRPHYHSKLKTALIGEATMDLIGRNGHDILKALQAKQT